MLVLTRKLSQSIKIGEDIEITVAEVHEDPARLGIAAPCSVSVHRREVWERVQFRNKWAADSGDPPMLPPA